MYATDFLFDGQCASDFGFMICSFNGDFETASGGEIEYNVIKTPGRDSYTFYGSQFNSTIAWNFSICKNPRFYKNMFFNQSEESILMKWLLKTDGYRLLQFKQDGYADIFYKAYFNVIPHQIAGRTVGFDLSAISGCAYGFTDVIKRSALISENNSLEFTVRSDVNTYILPSIKLTGSGDFYIQNKNKYIMKEIGGKQNAEMQEATEKNKAEFENIITQTTLIMDSDTDTISNLPDPKNFNWHFLRLADGKNTITTNSKIPINIEIQYREPRFVRI